MSAFFNARVEGYDEHMQEMVESFLTLPFGVGVYDCVISVMSLHHLPFEAKLGLYQRIHLALRDGGTCIEGDYIVSEEGNGQSGR